MGYAIKSRDTLIMNDEFERYRASYVRTESRALKERDRLKHQNARKMFDNKESIERAITNAIFPGLAVLELSNGRVGMGFFRDDTWLVSNAHVIHDNSDILEGIVIRTYNQTETVLQVARGYHRPWNSVLSPDIVVLNTQEAHTSISSHILSSDETYSGTHFFYVDADFQVHFLMLISNPNELPMQFICEDESDPKFGCSGAPIFSAEVLIDRIPSWRFEIVGAVYARAQGNILCGIPIDQEFEQIRRILIALDSVTRQQQRQICSTILGDRQQALISQALAEQDQAIAAAGIQIFTAGHSVLSISLPAGLERLAKNTYAKLEETYLQSIVGLSLSEVKSSFLQFFHDIQQQQSLFIGYDNDTPVLESEYWRLDCKKGGDKALFRILQIQDNTGSGVTVPGTSKSASSIFAQVKISKDIRYINGEPLRDDLHKSHVAIEQNKTEKEISIKIDFTTMDAIKRQKYQLTERRSASPSMRLFHAIPLTSIHGYEAMQQSVTNKEVDRLNGTNEAGDTPLMVLLKKQLADPGQRAKAKLLVSCSIWNQPNLEGKTAQDLLQEHSDQEALTSYFELDR
ncbi:MAG: hypothetical protein WCR08_08640 [Gammaproteobacteria bacterium]